MSRGPAADPEDCFVPGGIGPPANEHSIATDGPSESRWRGDPRVEAGVPARSPPPALSGLRLARALRCYCWVAVRSHATQFVPGHPWLDGCAAVLVGRL